VRRRRFLLGGAALGLQGCQRYGPLLFNPCASGLPGHLARHDTVLSALEGIDGRALWDGHVHLVGTGDSDSGLWINPRMARLFHARQYLQYRFYLNAACVDTANVDRSYVRRLLDLQEALPAGARLMLLAFDYTHDRRGRRRRDRSAFHTPNEYAHRTARQYPGRLEWIASVHPYREDSAEAIAAAAARGARAVKWLPPAMGINPASALCDPS